MKYQNVSAATWRRPSGEVVPPGAVFDATDREHARIQRRGHQQARVRLLDGPAADVVEGGADSVPDTSGGPVGAEAEASAQSPAAPSSPTWTLRMTPEVYLKLHPTGTHAAQARALVEA